MPWYSYSMGKSKEMCLDVHQGKDLDFIRRRLISEEEATAIMRVPIGSAAASDKLIWPWEKSGKNEITTLNEWFHDILFHDGLGKVDRARIASSLAFTCWNIWKLRYKTIIEGCSPSPRATVIASSYAISDFSRAKAHVLPGIQILNKVALPRRVPVQQIRRWKRKL
ncbi:unnamed protein product [Prunus armeniaca]|uniref:Uncharacterized protein n=1 Tax=Prunus armeniaca TaxID=36596 RepID=A0A6J5TJF9_PRUAR|nr:unnamed protein product [Prunus armeniaca]